jgi:hypothetical protein
MSAETAALLGVIAGALLAGIVQSAIEWTDRRRRGRAAARVVYAEVHRAHDTFGFATEQGAWWELPISTEGWRHYREDLAVAMPVDDFNTVAGAFYGVELLEDWRTRGNAFPPEAVQERVLALDRAKGLALWRGYSVPDKIRLWFRVKTGRHQKQVEELRRERQ